MQKIKMSRGVTLTFEEGCKKYLENCRQRNLRDGTINHYRQSYLYFYKYFDPKMPIEDIDEQTYKDYVIHLKKVLHNDTSINSYLRDLITTIHFFMNEGWLPHFKMQAIKVDKSHNVLTFEEGCNKYIDNCRQRNLREGTPLLTRKPVIYVANVNEDHAAKEAGMLRSEGKEYIMQDGDIVLFRFNV